MTPPSRTAVLGLYKGLRRQGALLMVSLKDSTSRTKRRSLQHLPTYLPGWLACLLLLFTAVDCSATTAVAGCSRLPARGLLSPPFPHVANARHTFSAIHFPHGAVYGL